MRFLFICFISHLFWFSDISAQQSSGQDLFNLNYTAPSPTVTAMNKYGNLSVGLSTGLPNISIPLYSYSDSWGLSMDFSINYNGGGTVVSEIPSNVGLGWVFNGHTVLSRVCRGLPDDYYQVGYIYRGQNQNPFNEESNYIQNNYDSEQDVFQVSIKGQTLKFILTSQISVVKINENAFKIEPILNSETPDGLPLKGFRITDISGFVYTFLDEEKTSTLFSNNLPVITYTSAWYLTSIKTPNKQKEIRIKYSDGQIRYNQRGSETFYNKYIGLYDIAKNHEIAYSSVSDFNVFNKRIDSILFPNSTYAKIVYYSTPRCDLTGDFAIKGFKVAHFNSPNQIEFRFFHSYFSTSSNSTYENPPCDLDPITPNQNFRLKLDSVVQINNNQIFLNPPYKFIYNPISLPPLDSYNIDYYGYYNGSINPLQTLVPSVLVSGQSQVNFKQLTGAIRTVDTIAIKAAILERIEYPSGGATVLDYEVNRAKNDFLIDSFLVDFSHYPDNDILNQGYYSFDINETVAAKGFKVSFLSWCPGLSNGCTLRFKILNQSNSLVSSVIEFTQNEIGIEKEGVISNLTPGTYKFIQEFDNQNCSCGDPLGILFSYDLLKIDSFKYAGGLRVKQITDYSNYLDTVFSSKRQFFYTDSSGKTSGTSSGRFEFSYNYFKEECLPPATEDGQPIPLTTRYFVRSSLPNYQSLIFSGSSVVYERVIEKRLGNDIQEGYTEHFFNGFGGGAGFTAFNPYGFKVPPFIPQQLLDWQIGNEIKVRYYDNSNTLLKEISNVFEFRNSLLDSMVNFKIGLIKNLNICLGLSDAFYEVKNYGWISGRSNLTSTREVIFSGSDSIVNFSRYEYDNENFLLKKTFSGKGLNDTIISIFYYPTDFSNIPSHQKLIELNNLSKKVGSEVYLKSSSTYKLLQSSFIFTKLFQNEVVNDRDFILNTDNFSFTFGVPTFNFLGDTLNSSFFTKNIFVEYLDDGRPKSISSNDIITNYDWSEYSIYPYVVAKNAERNDYSILLFGNMENSEWDVSNGTISEYIHPLAKSRVFSGSVSKSNIQSSGSFYLFAWVKGQSSLNSSPGELIKNGANGWKLLKWSLFNPSSLLLSADSLIYINFSKVHTDISVFVVDELIGLVSAFDGNGAILSYSHDSFNRLVEIKNDNGQTLKLFCYSINGAPDACDFEAVSQNPSWSFVDEFRCKPCSLDSQFYSSVRQQKQIDTNQNSLTYNNSRWVDMPDSSACYVNSSWQSNNVSRCQKNSSNLNTGFLENQQIDLNPCSETFNQMRWILGSYNTSSCALPVFAKLSYENYNYNTYNAVYADVVVRFYSDPNCTIPVNVSNLEVLIGINGYNGVDFFDDQISRTANGNTLYVQSGVELSYEIGFDLRYKDYYLIITNNYSVGF